MEETPKWRTYDLATIRKNSRLIEEFLERKVIRNQPLTWRETPVKCLRRKHLNDLLAEHMNTPHKAKHLLVAIRKLLKVALDAEWITNDPSYRIEWRPIYKGWKAWTEEARQKFEFRHPIGSAARTCYGLAIWLGDRRGDVAALRWDDFVTEEVELLDGEVIEVAAFRFRQRKNRNRTGGKEMFVVVTPMLEEILKPLDRTTPTVLVNGYGQPFSEKSLTGMMAHWTKQASLEPGYTLHGLRKSLGKNLAESGATTREIMACLGRDHIGQAELYSRDAEQRRLVVQAMQKLTAVELRRRLRFAGSKK